MMFIKRCVLCVCCLFCLFLSFFHVFDLFFLKNIIIIMIVILVTTGVSSFKVTMKFRSFRVCNEPLSRHPIMFFLFVFFYPAPPKAGRGSSTTQGRKAAPHPKKEGGQPHQRKGRGKALPPEREEKVSNTSPNKGRGAQLSLGGAAFP